MAPNMPKPTSTLSTTAGEKPLAPNNRSGMIAFCPSARSTSRKATRLTAPMT